MFILIPASPPGAPDGEVTGRQGSRQMALSGRTDDGRGVEVDEAFELLAETKSLPLV